MDWLKWMLAAVAVLVLATGASAIDEKKEQAKLAGLKATYVAAKQTSAKAPADAAKKAKYVQATLAYGDAVMNSPILKPKDKYPQSLGLFREAKKADPKNKTAAERIQLIEDIYRSMGRPVPK